MNKNSYKLSFNTKFNEVIEKISSQHKYNWLKDEYVNVLKNLYKNSDNNDFKIISVELVSKESNKLIAGEIGYIIKKTYTSLSGFSSKEKQFNNCGTLQLVLLSKYLQNNNFKFWNLGHPHMLYKKKLGCTIYKRDEFLNLWDEAIRS